MHYSEEALIECGRALARHLQVKIPQDKLFCEKIHEILVKRGSYESALQGLITQEETASLILQHFQTLVCHSAGVPETSLTKSWRALTEPTREALFQSGPT